MCDAARGSPVSSSSGKTVILFIAEKGVVPTPKDDCHVIDCSRHLLTNYRTKDQIMELSAASIRGPLRTLEPPMSFDRWRGIRPAGHCAALMSPGPGCARPSSFTSLRTVPHQPDPTHRGGSPSAHHQRCLPRASGAHRSEVKEEGWAQARPGGHERRWVPGGLGSHRSGRRTSATGREPPVARVTS